MCNEKYCFTNFKETLLVTENCKIYFNLIKFKMQNEKSKMKCCRKDKTEAY